MKKLLKKIKELLGKVCRKKETEIAEVEETIEIVEEAEKMSRNLNNILREDIFRAFKEGQDKHAMKRQGLGDDKIWSYQQRANLLDITKNLCGYIKENYPEVRRKEALTPYHIERWLEAKAAAGCTQKTVDAYAAAARKIGKIAGIEIEPGKITAQRKKSADRGAGAAVSAENYQKIMEYCAAHPSGSAAAILLERQLGVRVADLAYGVKITPTELQIKSKGGKICTRPMTAELRILLDSPEVAQYRTVDGRLLMPKDDSINRYLRRTQDKLGLPRNSFHDLRRFVAQEKYDHYRNYGMTRQQALGAVGVWLNHGPHREALVLESYVDNAW